MKNLKLIQTALIAMCVTLAGCDNAIFSKNDGNEKATAVTPAAVGDLIFLQDSFERDDIFADFVNNITYGWRGFVVDGTTPAVGFQSNGAGSSIPAAGALGPAADQNRFLLMNGRSNGAAVETLQVITQSYDLSQFDTAIISFKYLTFALNDADDVVPEVLQLQVCRGTLNECGANDDVLDPNGLVGDKWVTVFSSDTTFNDDALNGKNHQVSDWRQAEVSIDLTDPNFVGDSSTFVMRFVGVMKDGFNPGTPGGGTDPNCKCHKPCKKGEREVATSSVDTHQNQNGQGHYEHGNGYGYGHTKCKKDDHKGCDHKHNKCKHKHHGCGHHPKPPKPPCECNTDPGTPPDGTLIDGIAIDDVVGRATSQVVAP